jgi:hypothetical protein
MEKLNVCSHSTGSVKPHSRLSIYLPNRTDLVDSLSACPPSDSDDISFDIFLWPP